MNADYAQKLQALRLAFGAVSETPLLADVIRRHVSGRRRITMLDVGIGSGAATRTVLAHLRRHGIRAALTGLDPFIPAPARRLRWSPRPELVAQQLAEFRPRMTYDVVNATHSLYYLGDERAALRRLVSLVSPGGLLTVTIWADGCTLKALHDRYLAPGHHSPSPQQVGRRLAAAGPRGCAVTTYLFDGTITLEPPGAAGREGGRVIREAILEIAGRGAAVSEAARRSALDHLVWCGGTAPRRNAILAAVPAAQPPLATGAVPAARPPLATGAVPAAQPPLATAVVPAARPPLATEAFTA